MPLYPIALNLSGRRALVVGLGRVGRRKASGLITAGAHVLGVDPSPPAEGVLPEGVEVRPERYRRAHLRGVVLAFAAGPPAVNRRVVADARRARVWVNSASDPAAGDFSVPATWREGPLTLTVSTEGASPALASALRDRAAAALGPAAAGLAALLAELRPLALARLPDPSSRRRLLAAWADPRHLATWAAAGPAAVRRDLLRALDEAADGTPRVREDL
jgi:precorrin-2 dehydrogenase / sirohydrochlorin ferrochelatase